MIWHHYLVILGIFCGLYGGFTTVLVSNLGSLCEVSAIFLNYRSFFTKEEMNDPIPTINQTCFFFAYTIFRVLLFPYCFYEMFRGYFWTRHLMSVDREIAYIICLIFYALVMVLNAFWYGLILKGLKKML